MRGGDRMTFSRVFITGDTHGDIDIEKINVLKENIGEELKKDPMDKLLIICGDFGMIFGLRPDEWERKMLQYYRELHDVYGITVATVFGNHENYDRIESEFPLVEKWGDEVRPIADFGPYYLTNGGYYTFETANGPFTVLAYGGAASHDYPWRTPHKSWWPQEIPTRGMLKKAKMNLKKHDKKVDLIVTHTIPYKIKLEIFQNPFDDSLPNIRTVEKQLQKIYNMADFGHWYAGHHHMDINLDSYNMTILYQAILELSPGVFE